MTEQAVVIATYGKDSDRDDEVYGPFDSGQDASHWAFANITDVQWYWLPLTKPLAPEGRAEPHLDRG